MAIFPFPPIPRAGLEKPVFDEFAITSSFPAATEIIDEGREWSHFEAKNMGIPNLVSDLR
jgi:hypothetical protein